MLVDGRDHMILIPSCDGWMVVCMQRLHEESESVPAPPERTTGVCVRQQHVGEGLAMTWLRHLFIHAKCVGR